MLRARPTERDRVLNVLEDLAKLGAVTALPGKRFRVNKESKGPRGTTRSTERGRRGEERSHAPTRSGAEVTGVVVMHPNGFGFVVAEDGGPDVFIPPPAIGPAIQGDVVRARAQPSPKGREGVIVHVLEHTLRRVTGTLRSQRDGMALISDDPRMRSPMRVIPPWPEDIGPDTQVIAEIVRYPRDAQSPIGVRVTEKLDGKSIGGEVKKLVVQAGVTEEFPEDVRREAAQIGRTLPQNEVATRTDLRHLALVTIDPEDARDHDDAVWAERTANGYHVVIAIADVSHYVRPGTAIDREARERGCSIYLPDRVIPMLPAELSTHMASLVPNQDRFCLAVDVVLDRNGSILAHHFIEGVMRSPAKITYGGAARALEFTRDAPLEPEAQSRTQLLGTLRDVAEVLRASRMQRGSLDFDLPEAKVKLDTHGVPIDVFRSRRDPGIRRAYNIVEELMLLANEVVASDLHDRRADAIYRVHGAPDAEKIERFAALAQALGHPLDIKDATHPKTLSKFMAKMPAEGETGALHYLLLRSMQQAIYSTTNIGHFGLAAPNYLHFTSPIRRYPDLAVHRVVRALIRKERPSAQTGRTELDSIAAQSSRRERRAMELERNVVDLCRAFLMRDRVGEEFEATVTGVTENGFYTSFDEPFVDAFTPLGAIAIGGIELDELGIRLTVTGTGESYVLGDRLRMRLEEVLVSTRRLTAVPASWPKDRIPREPPRREPARPRREPSRQRPTPRKNPKESTGPRRGKKTWQKKGRRKRK